jgi:hypothetical protein
MRRNECDRCGLAACDLPDGVEPELIFERVGTAMLCQGCQNVPVHEECS